MDNKTVIAVSDALTMINHLVVGEMGAEPVTLETNFEDIGLDSLDLVELQLYLEHDHKIEISDEAIADVKTGDDLVKLILAAPAAN